MKKLNLGQVVRSKAARDGITGPAEDPNFRTPQHTRVAVAEALKFYCLPTQAPTPFTASKYLEALTPNIRAMAKARFQRLRRRDAEELSWEIATQLIAYMLDKAPTVEGNPERWTLYSPTGTNKAMPYFKWVLTHVPFFISDHLRTVSRDRVRQGSTLSLSDHDELSESANRALSVDSLVANNPTAAAHMSSQPLAADGSLFVIEVGGFFQKQALSYVGRFGYEANSYELFLMWFDGAPKSEMAAKFGISPSAVTQWVNKLKADLEQIGHSIREA